MRELLAERAPRNLIAVTAVATLAIAGATAVRPHAHVVPHHTRALAVSAPLLKDSQLVDLDGDGIPELVAMSFAIEGNELVTRVSLEQARDGGLMLVDDNSMWMSAPLDPAPCIGTVVAWAAGSPGGGRIEVSSYYRYGTEAGNAVPTCELDETRTYRLRSGHLLQTGQRDGTLGCFHGFCSRE